MGVIYAMLIGFHLNTIKRQNAFIRDTMNNPKRDKAIRLAVAGVGNCASSLIEGIAYYRQHPEDKRGLLFPVLGGYSISDIDMVAAFDISRDKVGHSLGEAMGQAPNNFVRIRGVEVDNLTVVQRGPTLDGNPPHLAVLVPESSAPSVETTVPRCA